MTAFFAGKDCVYKGARYEDEKMSVVSQIGFIWPDGGFPVWIAMHVIEADIRRHKSIM